MTLPQLAVGDSFRIYNRALSASGTVTKINRVNFKYDSLYDVGNVRELMHLELPLSALRGEGVQIKRKVKE